MEYVYKWSVPDRTVMFISRRLSDGEGYFIGYEHPLESC